MGLGICGLDVMQRKYQTHSTPGRLEEIVDSTEKQYVQSKTCQKSFTGNHLQGECPTLCKLMNIL
jgi:hypothetical protein